MREQAEFQLRPAVRGDELTIHALHRASATRLCTSHYDLDLIEHWIAARTPEGYLDAIDRGEMFVCEVNGRMAGFGHAVPGEIEAIFVHPDWARRGVGSRPRSMRRPSTSDMAFRRVAGSA